MILIIGGGGGYHFHSDDIIQVTANDSAQTWTNTSYQIIVHQWQNTNWYRIVIAEGFSPNWHRPYEATSRNYITFTYQISVASKVSNQRTFYTRENTI